MISYEEYLRYKGLCEAFDMDDPATYFTATPELQAILDEEAVKARAEYEARVAAQTPADYDRWDTPLGITRNIPGQWPTPKQKALVKMLNVQFYIIELAEKMGWEAPDVDYIGRHRGD